MPPHLNTGINTRQRTTVYGSICLFIYAAFLLTLIITAREEKNNWAWIHHDIIIDPFVIFYGGASFKRQVMISVIRQSYLPSVIYPAPPALLFAEYQQVQLWRVWMDRCGSAMLDGTEYGSSQCFAHRICWKASECLAHLDRDLVQPLKRSGVVVSVGWNHGGVQMITYWEAWCWIHDVGPHANGFDPVHHCFSPGNKLALSLLDNSNYITMIESTHQLEFDVSLLIYFLGQSNHVVFALLYNRHNQ